MKLFLDPISAHAAVPKEYDLSITNMKATNTFIFTEKDRPGFRTHLFGHEKADIVGAGSTGFSRPMTSNRVQKYKGKRIRRSVPSKLYDLIR